jgi:hypothetical protein
MIHEFVQDVIVGANENCFFEISLKQNGRTKVRIIEPQSGSYGDFDLSDGSVSSNTQYGITSQVNDWYRCSIGFLNDNNNSVTIKIQLFNELDELDYDGDDISGIYMWGGQLIDSTPSNSGYVKTTNEAIIGSLDSNSDKDKVTLLSENIDISDYQPNTLAIKYYNTNNRDIFYKYGIENFIRIPYVSIKAGIQDDSEVLIGDLSSSLTTSTVHEIDEFTFTDLTDEIMRKLAIALSCDNVFINDVGYVKSSDLTIETIENTNLHELKAIMIKTNINYNNNRQGQTGKDIFGIDVNIPPFLTDGVGFIKI